MRGPCPRVMRASHLIHLVRCILGEVGPDEVLDSSTVRDLVAGSDLRFAIGASTS